MVDFLFVINKLFSLSLTVETLQAEICWSRHFHQTVAATLTNHCWCKKTGVIALSCSIKMSAVHHLVLSQCTRVTDRRTELGLPWPC